MRQGEVVLYVPLSVVFFQHFGKGYHRLLVRFSAKCPNCVIFGMVVVNDIENIFAKCQPPELI